MTRVMLTNEKKIYDQLKEQGSILQPFNEFVKCAFYDKVDEINLKQKRGEANDISLRERKTES